MQQLNAKTCVDCPTGQSSVAGSTSCTACAAGYHSVAVHEIAAAAVTMSSFSANHPPEFCTDDNLDNYCHSLASATGNWITLDLGAIVDVRYVSVYNRATTDAVALARLGQHTLSTSSDGTTYTLCGEYDVGAGDAGPYVEQCSATAQYVRLTQLSTNHLNLAELRVYAAASPTAGLQAVPVVAAAMSSAWFNGNYEASSCVNGIYNDPGDFCHSSATGTGMPWLQLDLGSTVEIRYLEIFNRVSSSAASLARLGKHVLETSVDGTTFTLCGEYNAGAGNASPYVEACHANARYVRVRQTTSTVLNLAEVRVYTAPGLFTGVHPVSVAGATMGSASLAYSASTCIDGDFTSYNYCQSSTDDADNTITLDLGSLVDVRFVAVYNRKTSYPDKLARLGQHTLSTSIDGTTYTLCGQYDAGDGTNSPYIEACNAPARYVRLTQLSANYLNLAELRVYTSILPNEGMLHRFPVAEAYMSNVNATHPATNCIDGDLSNYCHSLSSNAGNTITLDLGAPVDVRAVAVYNRDTSDAAALARLGAHTLSTSNDGTTFTTCLTYDAGDGTGSPFVEPCSAAARYVRLTQLSANFLNLAELRVYGPSTPTLCTACPAGKYQTAASSGTCTVCPAGKHSAAGATSCLGELCIAGRFAPVGSASAVTCAACPVGKYAESAGQASCEVCHTGTSSSEGSTGCGKTCEKGHYSTISIIHAGTCDTPVSSADRCSELAGALQLADTTATSVTDELNTPPGCVFRSDGQLYLNDASSSPDVCDASSQCLCDVCSPCHSGTYASTVGPRDKCTGTMCAAGTVGTLGRTAGCTADSGTCGSMGIVVTADVCQRRAAAGQPVTVVPSRAHPGGCYESGGATYYNPAASGVDCSATNVCLCNCGCTACPAGQYMAEEGQSAPCLPCPSGKNSDAGSASCHPECAAGRYASAAACVDCPVGRYSPLSGINATCQSCPAAPSGSSTCATTASPTPAPTVDSCEITSGTCVVPLSAIQCDSVAWHTDDGRSATSVAPLSCTAGASLGCMVAWHAGRTGSEPARVAATEGEGPAACATSCSALLGAGAVTQIAMRGSECNCIATTDYQYTSADAATEELCALGTATSVWSMWEMGNCTQPAHPAGCSRNADGYYYNALPDALVACTGVTCLCAVCATPAPTPAPQTPVSYTHQTLPTKA